MRYVCPKDVKKMLLQQARTVYWKKWVAKHEHEELKEGIWLEPALALLRKKTKEDWTEKRRNIARKLVLEGGWVQKKLFDIGWSDESKCQACRKEEGTEKNRNGRSQRHSESGSRKRTLQRRSGKEVGIVTHFLSESQCNRGHFSMIKWESEKHKSWSMPAGGFKGHVATDGSLLGTAEKWRACGWPVVQLDFDEESRPLHGMYGSVEAEFGVQRTIKRAELTAFLCLSRKLLDPSKCTWTSQELQMGFGEEKGNALIPKLVMRTCGKIWEELHLLTSEEILVEVEHVKAHRTKKDKKTMTHFEKFVTEGNEEADGLAKGGAMLDEGFMAEVRAKTVQQEREREKKCTQPCSMHPAFTVWWKNGRIVRSSSRSQKKG